MPGLVLDSSTDHLIVALSGLDKPLFQVWENAAKIGSQLISIVSSFLEKHTFSLNHLSYIAVGRGPGSYTGTRAAVAAATGISMGCECPLVHFPSLLAFLPSSTTCMAALEIKGSNNFFTLFYEEGKVVERVLSQEELTQESCDIVYPPFRFIPEIALPRITKWISEQAHQPKDLVYTNT